MSPQSLQCNQEESYVHKLCASGSNRLQKQREIDWCPVMGSEYRRGLFSRSFKENIVGRQREHRPAFTREYNTGGDLLKLIQRKRRWESENNSEPNG